MGHNKKKENNMKPIRIVWGVAPLILALIARAVAGCYHKGQTIVSHGVAFALAISSRLGAASTITESSSYTNLIGSRVGFD